MPLRIDQSNPPTMVDCLRCQMLGRRNLLCSTKDACQKLPVVLPLGPLLLAGWIGTAIAFVILT